ncbi:MAG: rhomboid family intrarane serine protease [Cypionkella sp.]|uniref:rhomboid family intramembrane serine protease n=1 Tax=Cypionkella sp. TaxID=2811411 RepID=UPI0026154E13|nr:rhomboid family intramembrane serine protease [Cypionkella sp.]MDB5661590.1 rhomboid family intrarane serine protease [Cypionkella sp.]
MTPPAPPPGSAKPRRGQIVLIALILACMLPEIILLAADFGLMGSPRWRPLAYQYGAFWAGLLHGWRPNFAAQPITMFLTHAFLHTGPLHLIGNMLALAALGQAILERHGAGRFLLVYIAAALGGGAAFGLLSYSAVPMVGASGAIFGLAGAQLVWRWQDQLAAGLRRLQSLAELCGGMVGLVVINLLMWWIQGGLVAWQTHLGGTLIGAIVAALRPVQRPILANIRS